MKHRLFLAIELPRTFYETVISIQDMLKKVSPLITAVPVEDVYLPTNFFGRVDQERIPGIIKILEKEFASHRPFMLQPYFISSFYKRHEPSQIFLEPAGDLEELKDLQKGLNLRLEKLMLPYQDRFTPQFTIATVQRIDPTSAKQVLDKVHQIDITPLPKFEVDHVSLYETKFSKNGPDYKKTGEFTLG